MASSKNMHVFEARKQLPNMWHSELLRTPIEDPLYCCYSMWCPCCAAYGLRGRVLYNDWSRYQCCGGGMPCSGSCGEEKCPQLCAVLEVTMCFTLAVSATRFMLQDALQIQNTKCDNCIIASMFFAQYLNCLCWILAMVTNVPFIDDAAIITDRIADISYCTVCACIQTQHKLELDKRDGKINPRETIPLPSKKCPGTNEHMVQEPAVISDKLSESSRYTRTNELCSKQLPGVCQIFPLSVALYF